MTEKRNIAREDVFLKTRILAEGHRLEIKTPPDFGEPTADPTSTAPRIVLDGCDVVVGLRPYERSRLKVVINGNAVTILDLDSVVGKGTIAARAPWRDKRMSDGRSVNDVIGYDTGFVTQVTISNRCAVYDEGKGCRFCIYGHLMSIGGEPMAFKETIERAARQIEALAIAIESGFRGAILLVGGALPPESRDQYTTDLFEAIMERLHEIIDADILSQFQIAADVYPPADLGLLHKWKRFGVNSCQFDSQVLDPAYFAAICPGRGDQKHWHEAQEAAAEVFGRGSTSLLVTGIEPMAGMLEGIEERVSKGVYIQPVIFTPMPESPMAKMRPPSAEWFAKANDRIVDIQLQYADTFDVDLTTDDRWGYTRRGNSYETAADDEMTRRLQQMGKLPPGLPQQDGITLT